MFSFICILHHQEFLISGLLLKHEKEKKTKFFVFIIFLHSFFFLQLQVLDSVNTQTGNKYSKLTAVKYGSQVVAGTNYFVKVWFLTVFPMTLPFNPFCKLLQNVITSIKILYINTILHAEILSKKIYLIHVFMVIYLTNLTHLNLWNP